VRKGVAAVTRDPDPTKALGVSAPKKDLPLSTFDRSHILSYHKPH